MALSDLVEYLGAAKTALELLKGVQSEFPKGDKADKVQEQITKAETSLKQSEAELAKALGFRLCRCSFPPQIMLWNKDQRVHVCPACNDHWPHRPEVQHSPPGGSSWTRARRG